MTLDPKTALRLQFLARVVRKECRHLAITDSRLFTIVPTVSAHPYTQVYQCRYVATQEGCQPKA